MQPSVTTISHAGRPRDAPIAPSLTVADSAPDRS